MSDDATLRVEAKFKNARLYQAIHDAVSPGMVPSRGSQGRIAVWCRMHGLNLSWVYELINLRRHPLRERKEDGETVVEMTALCKTIASALGKDPTWLFPADLYDIEWPRGIAIEVGHERFLPLSAAPRTLLLTDGAQESNMNNSDLARILRESLSTLTPREQKVMRMRFGLDDGEEHSLAAVGMALESAHGGGGLSVERVRQIEAKAMRKMRHASRSRRLIPFLMEK